ncbi:MAG: hypothetical protein QNJ54_02885 [Prochloraceae cyanobacterium]|nr:hypothetical protein [Prochloraceae cyanobacterium]
MYPSQEITALRKAGRLDQAYSRGYELMKTNPDDRFLATSFGWVLYEKVKKIVDEAKQSQSPEVDKLIERLRNILREYARLRLSRTENVLFSLLLSQTLRFPKPLKFLPKFIKWAGIDSFRSEDFQVNTSNEGKVFESLVEKVAREVGKVVRDLKVEDCSNSRELQELQEFAVELIDTALRQAQVQNPQWLHYSKALLLGQLGRLEEAQKLLVSVVQQKRNDFWAWHALAKVVEESDRVLALALCAKACLTCKDPKFGVGTFEYLSKLAGRHGKMSLAKWSADRAFEIRNNNQWKIPPSLSNLLNADWYSHTENLANANEVLTQIAADAEKVIWINFPRYDANYLGTFTSKSGKLMVKFGLFSGGSSQELASSALGLLNNLNLVLGDPVKAIVDESGDRQKVVVVEKRESGKPFDRLESIYGIVDRHCDNKAFIYFNPYQHCTLPYTEFPTIANLTPGSAIEVICARNRDRINAYRFSPSTFIENENISLRVGFVRLHQKGFGFVEDVFVPPELASQLENGQQVNLIIVKKLDKKKNQLGWSAIAILNQILP